MALVEALQRILERPTMVGVYTGLMMFLAPIWIAFVLGVMVGWAWKPKWVNLVKDNLGCFSSNSMNLSLPSTPSVSDESTEKRVSISPSEVDDFGYFLNFMNLFFVSL